MSLNFSSMIQSLITTQLASAAAKKDAAAMARQMGVQGRYFLPYGNQSTGGTGGSSGGFSALALLSFWPMAQSFLQEIISAGISAKQQAQSGNTPGNNPSTNPSDSAVESGKQKDIDKSEKNRLQQQYRDSEVTSQLIGGPDWESPDGEFSFDNLKNAATGKSMAAENMNNYKANADGVKNAASKVSGNATGSDAKAINEGITALNNSIKENGLSSITLLYTGFTPENKFTNPDPDNPIKIEDIQTEKKGVNTELNNIEKDRTAYKAVIDYKKFDANDSRINFGEEKITYTNKDGTTVEIDYTPGMSLPEDIKDDATAKTNFNTQKNNFETKRSETVKKMNEQ